MNIFKLIEEVWQDLMKDSPNLLSDLKKAIIIAKHFNDNENKLWMENEFDGYYSRDEKEKITVPAYRQVKAIIPLKPDIRIETDWEKGIRYLHQKDRSEAIDMPMSKDIGSIIDIINKFKSENKAPSFICYSNDDGQELHYYIPIEFFEKIFHEIEKKLSDFISYLYMGQKKAELDFEEPLMRVLNNFHHAAIKYNSRHGGKPGIVIENEYDVQDLLHILLIPYYSTIKPEEYTTTMAGKSHRIDFLSIADRTGLEIKFITNENKTKISDQISADKDGYSKDNRIDNIYFFLYDPNYLIADRNTYKQDLEQNQPPKITIKIIIKPD